nr:MAG TPA: SOS-response transcriptional repressor [Caudoviricetes sp.]
MDMEAINLRINELCKVKFHGKIGEFARRIGVSDANIRGYIVRNIEPGYKFFVKCLEGVPDLSPEWLILGRGDMCKPITSTQNQANQANDDNTLERLIRTQAETIETQRKLIEAQERLLELLKKE